MRESPLWQPISSLRSLQSGCLSHWRLPWIQEPSLHWNSSGRQVGRPRKRRQMVENKEKRQREEAERNQITYSEQKIIADMICCASCVNIDDTEYVQAALDGNMILCMLKHEQPTSVRLHFLLKSLLNMSQRRFIRGKQICRRGDGWNK